MLSVCIGEALTWGTANYNVNGTKSIKDVLIVNIMYILIEVFEIWMVASISLSCVRVFLCSNDHTYLTSTFKAIAQTACTREQVNYSVNRSTLPSQR